MKVSIVIPCYNEKNTIEEVVEAVRNAPLNSKEIIVVDDCSQDGTQTLLREKISAVVDQIIYHPVNRGKGAALRSGFAAAIIQCFCSRLSPARRTPFLALDSWADDHIASFSSGTWSVTSF